MRPKHGQKGGHEGTKSELFIILFLSVWSLLLLLLESSYTRQLMARAQYWALIGVRRVHTWDMGSIIVLQYKRTRADETQLAHTSLKERKDLTLSMYAALYFEHSRNAARSTSSSFRLRDATRHTHTHNRV